MKTSLTWRFAAIALIVALASYIVKTKPILYGIDLAGGTSLLYELDLSKVSSANPSETTSQLAERVVQVLKDRVDKNGVKNFQWRVIGDKRIQVQMPLADQATRDARKALNEANEALRNSELKVTEVRNTIHLQGAARDKQIDADFPARPGDSRNELMKKLAKAGDALEAATARQEEEAKKVGVANVPEEYLHAKNAANAAYDQALSDLMHTNVDLNEFNNLLSAADDPDTYKDAPEKLKEFADRYPAHKEAVERVIKAHEVLMAHNGGGVEDPEDLKRLITAAGVLDFRITVQPSDLGDPSNLTAARDSLQANGPGKPIPVPTTGTQARWFEIDANGIDNFKDGYITAEYGLKHYVLCFDDVDHALTHGPPRKPWTASAKPPHGGPEGVVLPFNLDPNGADYMSNLTLTNKGRQMAILLDDRAMSAPTINGHISDSGEITFGKSRAPAATLKEANDLKRIMDAGSLPAALQHDPISEVEISSELGAANISDGLHSGLYALIAVVAFMVVYYTITGAFADLALGINLLLVLAAMASLSATLTLPGIAGLVLTLGMAVDANVLINERIREELHKGASLWMAVKQGYDKVFWTIFDANLTTSLTSIVLIFFGSEEVKGFGVTLLIGLCIHMFTALFVTRTLMMASIRVGIIRAIDDHSLTEYLREIFTLTWLRNGHFPFMRVITVTNIDWIGKRHIFWVISAITIIAGLVVFIARGEDKYDIEFRGGTQITFPIKAGLHISRDDIDKRIKALHTLPGLADLESARIYGTGKKDENGIYDTYEMQTTIANTKDDPSHVKTALLEPLADHLKDILDQAQPIVATINGKPSVLSDDPIKHKIDMTDVNELFDQGVLQPIEAETLDKVFAKTGFQGIPNRDVNDQLHGLAILLDNMSPPISAKNLTDRINQIRGSQDPQLKDIPNRGSKVIPITALDKNGHPIPADPDDLNAPLTRAVIVSKDETRPHSEANDATWRQEVALGECTVIQNALGINSLFKGVTTFDAVVAGQAKMQALLSIILSLFLIVVYVWIRFGGIRYGIGAILSLVHDAIVALAATVLSGEIYNHLFHQHSYLLISDFKINLTMIAAYLTVIGYSVNDTIVIFDRVRELRGKSNAPLSAKLVNDAINQCFGRTIWTTFTVFIVVLIMYVWGGEGVRGFSFAMLVGVITGAYSTLAIASPMLLTAGTAPDKSRPAGGFLGGADRPGGTGPRNPFLPSETT